MTLAADRVRRLCSQMRITLQPRARSARSAFRSRRLLPWIFRVQNSARVTGSWKCFGQPCQKQPSAKIAILTCGNAKSGRPGIGQCRRHPRIRRAAKIFTRARSVEQFPRLRILDMSADLSALVITSATSSEVTTKETDFWTVEASNYQATVEQAVEPLTGRFWQQGAAMARCQIQRLGALAVTRRFHADGIV